MRKGLTIAAAMLICLIAVTASAEEARLLRFPDIHNNQIVFSHGGDLWLVPAAGGEAKRLTTHEALELFPRFSPDGRMIAFTGQVDGDQNVFVIPAEGGEPKRLTWHPAVRATSERMGPEAIVMDWSKDGRILYRSRQETYSVWEGRLCLVDPDGGYPQPLALPRGGFAAFNADETKLAYTPIFRDFRTWKRYKGGAAQDVWIYDFAQKKSEKITDWEGTDNMPMWDHASGKIYFNSDRTGTLNIYAYDPQTKQTTQVTNFTEFDVRWPAMGPGAIVFENGGYLYVLDLPAGQPRKVNITLSSDDLLARPHYVNARNMIREFTLSADAKRAIFTARGEVFTVPAEHGNTRNLTNTPGAHEKYASISPDGKWIAYVSDMSGEDEIYLIAPGGKGQPVRLTTDGSMYLYGISWSPDSKKIAWSDKSTNLWYIDIDTKEKIKIDNGERGDLRYHAWSPDSRWLTYNKNNKHNITQVWVYSIENNVTRAVTPGEFDDWNGSFDKNGKYLYFLSNRDFNPILGNYEFDFILDKQTEVHAILLAEGTPSPFAPESDEIKSDGGDEEENGDEGKDDKKGDKKDKKKGPDPVKIDFDGITARTFKIPVDAGQYGDLQAANNRVFYISSPIGGLDGRIEDAKRTLHVYDLEEKKHYDFLEDIGSYELTPDGKTMIISKSGNYEIIKASGEKAKTGDQVLDLSHMEMWLDPVAEWKQIFEESWRLQRDYFYDTNFHGVDWKAVHDRYAPLVDHVKHRFDLTYILGEMIGELATGHTYVGGGEMPSPDASGVGLLGNDWVIDSAAGMFRVGRILDGQNWIGARRSPLSEPGLKVAADDYVIAINGHKLTSADNPYRLLNNTVGTIVTLELSDSPSGSNSWTIDVEPLDSESQLRYHDFVARKAHYTDSISGGRIGYIHIPDMGTSGLKQFTSTYYAQIRKEGMVVDVRWNGGGFVSQLIIERLARTLGGMGKGRNFEPYTYPNTVFHGHLACLHNEHSASDGDIFPYYFRKFKLGPLFGTRTWGGVVGIRGHRPFLDGGYMTTPEFAKYSIDREWIMENIGVPPDEEVLYLPEDVMRGVDAQIDRAVQYLLQKIESEPMRIPDPPATPPDER